MTERPDFGYRPNVIPPHFIKPLPPGYWDDPREPDGPTQTPA